MSLRRSALANHADVSDTDLACSGPSIDDLWSYKSSAFDHGTVPSLKKCLCTIEDECFMNSECAVKSFVPNALHSNEFLGWARKRRWYKGLG